MSVDLKYGQTLTIGGAQVQLVKKSGQLARLLVTADESIVITPPGQPTASSGAPPSTSRSIPNG